MEDDCLYDFGSICDVIKQNESEVGQIQFSYSSLIINIIHHLQSDFFLQQTALKLVNWFQRYGQLKGCKNQKETKEIVCFVWLGLRKKDVCLSFSDRPKILENLGCFFFFKFNFAFLNKIVEIIIFKLHWNCLKVNCVGTESLFV